MISLGTTGLRECGEVPCSPSRESAYSTYWFRFSQCHTKGGDRLVRLDVGDSVNYLTDVKRKRRGRVVREPTRSRVAVHLEGDPFPVEVELRLVERIEPDMPNVKELRARAEELEVPDWEDMTIEELEAAVAEVESEEEEEQEEEEEAVAELEEEEEEEEVTETATKPKKKAKPSGTKKVKASSKKVKAKAAPAEGKTKKVKASSKKIKPKAAKSGKPSKKAKSSNNGAFKEGSQRDIILKALLKGGTLDEIAARVAPHFKVNPKQHKATDDYKTNVLRGRINVVARSLRNKGYDVEIEGRGGDAVYSVSEK